jgi:hypothetical protein
MKIYLHILLFLACNLAFGGDARKVERIFLILQTGAPGQTHTITEADLNAYLAEELAKQSQQPVKEFSVILLEGTFSANATVDMDDVELDEDSMMTMLFRSVLSGEQLVFLKGKVTTSNHVGRYETLEASLNGVTIPSSLVNMLLGSLGKRLEPPIDPTKPFDLPYGIREARLLPGKLVISN